MSTGRLLELWAPPPGYRLASILATTYQLQADFLEDDLLPVALGLRLPAARGRDFRLELEQALQTTDVTIYLHPDGYLPGRRRSPRIDLIPLPESRVRKLHAKVSLLRFVSETTGTADDQIVRLVIGSANLTAPGYRDNIEIAVALQDAPGADAETVTAVRDAAGWLFETIAPDTEQARRQHRHLQAVFSSRPVTPSRLAMRFIGMPGASRLLAELKGMEVGAIETLTLASPFWPTGAEPADVVSALIDACGGMPKRIRLIGPAQECDGRIYPEMPLSLLKHLIGRGMSVEVAAANPGYGCAGKVDEDEDEFADVGRGRASWPAWRPLHAKILLLESARASLLAAGSFNLTRKGLGLHGHGNTEAGMIWKVPVKQAANCAALLGFASAWQVVGQSPDDLVKEPPPMEGSLGQMWPDFILSITATRDAIQVKGDAGKWPDRLTMKMLDIRSRLIDKELHFDAWEIVRPTSGSPFEVNLPLTASWLESEQALVAGKYPALPDLEIELAWDQHRTTLPVVFLDKHEFPVVERTGREDERALIDWFLGLRPPGEAEPGGFGHSIDPVEGFVQKETSESAGILSYLIRDFVHALPGVHSRLADGATTETGLRAALLGPRSPLALAQEVTTAWRKPIAGGPKKTTVATAFQLAELISLVERVHLPTFPDGATDALRAMCLAQIGSMLADVKAALSQDEQSPALTDYLQRLPGAGHAAA